VGLIGDTVLVSVPLAISIERGGDMDGMSVGAELGSEFCKDGEGLECRPVKLFVLSEV
jgi:hypothetical protein